MSQGTSLTGFADFWLGTSGARMSDPGELESQASLYRTHLFKLMLKGLSKKKTLQAGKKIEDYVQLKYASTFGHFNATDTFTYTGDDSLTLIEVPWRFSKVHAVTYKHEIDLQNGGRDVVYKKVQAVKEATLELSWFEGMEQALWAIPNFDTMESATMVGTGQPLSIPCFVTTDGAMPTASNGILNTGSTGATASWTSIMTLSTTTYPNFKNQFKTFTNTDDTSRAAAGPTGVLGAMDAMYRLVQFRSPTNGEEYVKNTVLQKYKIICNGPSHDLLVDMARRKNTDLQPRADLGWPQGMTVYKGISVEYAAILDTLMYDTTAGTAEDGSGKKGYRWLWLNFNHIYPIFHSKNFRNLEKFDGGAANPNAMVMFEQTWHQLWCQNRREQGVVFAA